MKKLSILSILTIFILLASLFPIQLVMASSTAYPNGCSWDSGGSCIADGDQPGSGTGTAGENAITMIWNNVNTAYVNATLHITYSGYGGGVGHNLNFYYHDGSGWHFMEGFANPPQTSGTGWSQTYYNLYDTNVDGYKIYFLSNDHLSVSNVYLDGLTLTQTQTPSITPTFTITPTPTPLTNPTKNNFLCDGDMEQFPNSSCWNNEQTSFTNAGGQTQNFTFGRIRNSAFPPMSWFDNSMNGSAACHLGFHAVGPYNWNLEQGGGLGSSISQQFDFMGGTLYYKVRARSKWFGLLPPPVDYHSVGVAYIMAQNGTRYYMINWANLTPSDWYFYNGSVSLPLGTYKVVLSRGDELNTDANSADTVFYDDVGVGTDPFADQCSADENSTPTPIITSTTTETPNPQTQTAIALTTSTFTPGIPTLPSNTPGPSPTLPSSIIFITNCGFEMGSGGWAFNPQSYIALAGGPTGPQYGVAMGPAPAISQPFYIAGAGNVYFIGYVKGNVLIKTFNLMNGASIVWNSSYLYPDWTQLRLWEYLPDAGYYRIELDTGSFTEAAYYDGINLAYGDWPVNSWCMSTPTAGPTAFLTATPTPPHATRTPTITGTVTASLVWSTWTATPIGTPDRRGYYTNTPGPTETSLAATITSIVATQTSWVNTQNARGTTTPGYTTETPDWVGTGTPNPNGTPGNGIGPPQPGPGGNQQDCIRPDSPLALSWWMDYEVCRVLNFASFDNNNSATAVAIPTMFAGKEPFNSVGQVVNGLNSAQTQVAMYDWNNTGLPGVNQDVNPASPFSNLNSPESPWSGNKPTWNLNPNGNWSAFMNGYGLYCSTQLSNLLPALLSMGVCYALTLTRQIGFLPWIQFMISALSIFGIVRVVWQTIGANAFFGSVAEVKEGGGDSK